MKLIKFNLNNSFGTSPDKYYFFESFVVFDLDGTISNCEHRRHLVSGEKKDWRKFFAECVNDTPNEAVKTMLRILNAFGYPVVIVSARSDEVAAETLDWLGIHRIPFNMLWMREAGDFTPDQELKRAWLDKFDKNEIMCVFDDRDAVVKMWREQGLTCFQVDDGNF